MMSPSSGDTIRSALAGDKLGFGSFAFGAEVVKEPEEVFTRILSERPRRSHQGLIPEQGDPHPPPKNGVGLSLL